MAVGGAALLVVLGVLAVTFSRASSIAFDNGKLVHVGAEVAPGAYFCQSGEYVPSGAGALRLWVFTNGRRGGPVAVNVSDAAGAPVTSGQAPGGYVNTTVTVPIRHVDREYQSATVCARNEGRTSVSYMGDSPGPGETASEPRVHIQPGTVDPRLLGIHQQPAVVSAPLKQPYGPVVVRFEWHYPGSRSWLALSPTLARRVSLDKASFVGSWTFWVLAALMLGVGIAAIRLVVREAAT